MLENQRIKFDIPDDVHYFNCAYMGPLPNETVDAGIKGVRRKAHPWEINAPDFFTQSSLARKLFAGLINAQAEDIAIIPAVSYGTAVAALNLPIDASDEILVLEEEFPSNIYAWRAQAKKQGATIKTVARPEDNDWTSAVLEALDEKVKIAVLPHTHWVDGGQLNLKLLAGILHKMDCALVLDVTQSLGVVSLDVQKIQPDFLICATYKWLLGPYSLGFLYVDKKHHQGLPLEQGWVNRPGAENFSRLIDYTDTLNPDASRFDVGERSNMHLLPMAISSLERIHAWGPAEIEKSLNAYTTQLLEGLETLGFETCHTNYRSPHYLSVIYRHGLPADLLSQLASRNIFISQRGDHLRITPHLYNNQYDGDQLLTVLATILKENIK